MTNITIFILDLILAFINIMFGYHSIRSNQPNLAAFNFVVGGMSLFAAAIALSKI